MAADNSDSDFANLLLFNGSDLYLKFTEAIKVFCIDIFFASDSILY